MAGVKETTVKSKSKSRKKNFLCCFGISMKSSKKFKDEVKPSVNRKKKNKLFFWLRFRGKKTAVQTVPVETTSPKNLQPVSEIEELPPSPDQSLNSKLLIKKQLQVNSGNTGLEMKQSSESNTCRDVTTGGWKKETKKKCSSQQNSPRGKLAKLTKVFSQSVSFPAIQETAIATKNPAIRKRKQTSRKFDTLIGMSIILVTLLIMVIWGKFCAILCTSAWLYFIPRLRNSGNSNMTIVRNGDSKAAESRFSSEEYKKKVVLDGLLRRSRRKPIGVL